MAIAGTGVCQGAQPTSQAYFIREASGGSTPVCAPLRSELTGGTAGTEIKDTDNNILGISLLFVGDDCTNSDGTVENYKLNVTTLCPTS